MVMLYFLQLLLVVSVILIAYMQTEKTVFASLAIDDKRVSTSPIFDRQEIIDDKEDLINMSASTAKQGKGSNYIDINSVTYSSDGRFLNATLWPSSFTEKPARSEVFYGVLVDADLNNNTGFQGVDYKVEIAWNKSESKWKKTFGEFSSGRNERSLELPFNITLSSDEDERYIKLDLDLYSMLTPERYKLFFYAYANPPLDPSSNKTIGSGILDAVRWGYVPPPEFTINTEPKYVDMRAGEEEEILVQVNSTTGLQPIVKLNHMIPAGKITMNLSENNLSLPSFGIATTHLKIKIDEDTKPTLRRFFITGDLSFPRVDFTIPIHKPAGTSGNASNITIPILSKDVQKQTSVLMNVNKALSPSELLRSWISDWFTPISAIITPIIGAVSGIIGWRIGSKSKQKNEAKSKTPKKFRKDVEEIKKTNKDRGSKNDFKPLSSPEKQRH
jgi:hypothetical protein